VQLNESDLAFLRRMLDANDGDLQVVGDELHIAARTASARGLVELTFGSQLRTARAIADLAHQATAVTVTGWNPDSGASFRSTKSGDNLGPGTGRTGASILRNSLGARSEHLAHFTPKAQNEADILAMAAFDNRARSFVRVECTAEGNPQVRVGAQVSLRNLSRRFDNTYTVVRTTHRFDTVRGYETDFVARCAYLGEAR
jgi:phage protein D